MKKARNKRRFNVIMRQGKSLHETVTNGNGGFSATGALASGQRQSVRFKSQQPAIGGVCACRGQTVVGSGSWKDLRDAAAALPCGHRWRALTITSTRETGHFEVNRR